MAGLYVHIPFCKSRCIYCGFYSTTSMEWRQRYVDALCKEMDMRATEDIETIYLGGGTPSQLSAEQLQQLFAHIYKRYGSKARETTIEVNPDDVTADYATLLAQLGINRVSMGAQTFDDQRLRFLHRRHTASQVPLAVRHLRKAGIRNISIDLMYGFPNETLEEWDYDIHQALTLQVEHLSAYCLMIEEDTPLYRMNIEAVDEETERQMYELLIDRLTASGYEHYEISNFAKPHHHSQHNSNYWRDIPYIGIGASAHSYDLKSRQWNISDIKAYTEAIEQGKIPYEQEEIDEPTHYNDRITVALRTVEGLDLDTLSTPYRTYCEREAQRYIEQGLLTRKGSHLALTRKGLFVSDDIMSSLIYL